MIAYLLYIILIWLEYKWYIQVDVEIEWSSDDIFL